MGYEKFSFYTFLTHSKPPNHSRPVTRPAIFRGQIFFKKAGFLKTGLVQGRLATLIRITAARSRQDSWASSAKKIRPLEKKLGRKPATPQIT
jgi:hypothetical protein